MEDGDSDADSSSEMADYASHSGSGPGTDFSDDVDPNFDANARPH
jgi:hypothetical protein